MPGPIGKRDEERRRRNKPATETIKVDLGDTLSQTVEIPAPPMREHDEETGELLDEPEHVWHPQAVEWYLSLTRSGQAIFYEPSDWQTAYMLADQISRNLEPRPVQTGTDDDGKPSYTYMVVPMNGATLNGLLKGMASLMMLEGDRRRLKIELDRAKQREAAVGASGGNVIPISTERSNRFKKA